MAKSKWFCVAVEGATATDGRTIEKSWLTDIAATYNRATYGARVNLEHIRGFTPDGPFKAYGDVLAVRTEEVTLSVGGKDQKRLGLFAQIEPSAELVAFTKAKQKIYTSIEVAPDFAKSGKAGLVGLAVTDSPASLGTDILSFSTKADDPAAAAVKASIDVRKSDAANHLSSYHETRIEADAPEAKEPTLVEQLTAALLTAFGKKPEPAAPAVVEPPKTEGAPEGFAAVQAAITALAAGVDARLTKFGADLAAVTTAHAELKTKLDGTENHSTKRPPATGGGGQLAEF